MSTTAIFVELLIVGVQTAVWITLFTLAALGTDSAKNLLQVLEKWVALISVIVVGILYTVGIVVDRLVDMAYNKWRETSIPDAKKERKEFSWRRLFVFVQSGQASQFMEYSRSRVRIMRSSIPNLFLIALSLATFMQYNSVPANSLLRHASITIVLVAGIAFVPLGVSALRSLQRRHDEIVEDLAWLLLNQPKPGTPAADDTLRQVAAKLGFSTPPKREGNS